MRDRERLKAGYAGVDEDRSQRAEGDGCCHWKAAPGAQSSKAETGPSGEPGD